MEVQIDQVFAGQLLVIVVMVRDGLILILSFGDFGLELQELGFEVLVGRGCFGEGIILGLELRFQRVCSCSGDCCGTGALGAGARCPASNAHDGGSWLPSLA